MGIKKLEKIGFFQKKKPKNEKGMKKCIGIFIEYLYEYKQKKRK